MTLHLFLTLALTVACVTLAWALWDVRRRCLALETRIAPMWQQGQQGPLIAQLSDDMVDSATPAKTDSGVVVHFPSWMPDPPGPQIDHLGRELP